MSNWEDFATSSVIPSSTTRSEDQVVISNSEEYALFQEATFLKVADSFLILPSNLKREHFTDVVIHPMRTYKNHTLRTKSLTFAFHGFGKPIRYGKAIVSETAYPRGYRITRLWMGQKATAFSKRRKPNKWISWRQAITNMYEDDLQWT